MAKHNCQLIRGNQVIPFSATNRQSVRERVRHMLDLPNYNTESLIAAQVNKVVFWGKVIFKHSKKQSRDQRPWRDKVRHQPRFSMPQMA
jgi:hypothetical protein